MRISQRFKLTVQDPVYKLWRGQFKPVNQSRPIILILPQAGIFWLTPHDLIQGRKKWWALVTMVITFQVPQKAWNFQPTSRSNPFSRMILVHGISILGTRFTTDHNCYLINVKIFWTGVHMRKCMHARARAHTPDMFESWVVSSASACTSKIIHYED
jgi:hypothetical protein